MYDRTDYSFREVPNEVIQKIRERKKVRIPKSFVCVYNGETDLVVTHKDGYSVLEDGPNIDALSDYKQNEATKYATELLKKAENKPRLKEWADDWKEIAGI